MPNPENLIPARKGEVRNPNGKAKGTRNRSTIVRQIIEAIADGSADMTKFDVATVAVLEKAMKGDVQAWEKLADSAYGKITDKTEVSGPDGAPVALAVSVNFVKPDAS